MYISNKAAILSPPPQTSTSIFLLLASCSTVIINIQKKKVLQFKWTFSKNWSELRNTFPMSTMAVYSSDNMMSSMHQRENRTRIYCCSRSVNIETLNKLYDYVWSMWSVNIETLDEMHIYLCTICYLWRYLSTIMDLLFRIWISGMEKVQYLSIVMDLLSRIEKSWMKKTQQTSKIQCC